VPSPASDYFRALPFGPSSRIPRPAGLAFSTRRPAVLPSRWPTALPKALGLPALT
jgi:hypothetical protein